MLSATRRSWLAILLVALALAALASPAAAAERTRIIYNGRELPSDVPPEVVRGRTMAPLRVIAEAMGAQVSWEQGQREVRMRLGRTGVTLEPGVAEAEVTREGTGAPPERRPLDVAPYVRSGRTMVPVRFLAETFGAAVAWDADRRAVIVNYRPRPTVIGIRHELAGTGERLRVDVDPPGRYRVYALGTPHRLVLDIPDGRLAPEVPPSMPPAEGARYATQIRTGQPEAGLARVVVDLSQAVRWRVEPTPNGLWIHLAEDLPSDGRLVAVDAGHGGDDPGAVGPSGLREKDVTLDVAWRLAARLLDVGARVGLTRDGDVYVDLYERARVANAWGADLFVSIHFNASTNRSVSGIETYYHPNKPDSRPLAEAIQRELVAALGGPNRGVKTANFAVLRETAMPAVLVEANFISNPDVEAKLRTEEYRQRIADAIARGIQAYWASLSPAPSATSSPSSQPAGGGSGTSGT